jgi:hypothetical protein
MDYIVPGYADFNAMFPELAGIVSNDLILAEIIRASVAVDDSWTVEDYATAILLLAAHRLVLISERGRGDIVTAESFGPISVSYRRNPDSSSYSSTVYGELFEELLNANVGAPVLII